MKFPRQFKFAPIVLSLLAPAAFAAPGSDVSQHIATIIQAEPIERAHPKYPKTSARKGQEGWVKISFVVTEEGDVVDPIVQDSSGLRAFEKEALRAVKKWKYSPATQDGKPIQQCKNMVQMDFKINDNTGVTRQFMTQYRKVSDAINEQRLTDAEQMLSDLGSSQMWNMTESAFYWLADSYYAKEIGDLTRELKSVRRARAIHNDVVREKMAEYLYQREFVLALNLGEYNKALEAFETLKELADENDEMVARLAPFADKTRALVTSSEPMMRETRLDDEGMMYHDLSRSAFELVNTEGNLEEVQIRCDNKLSRFTAANESEWHIPASWGQCSVFVTGAPGAQVKVVELGDYVGDDPAGES